MKLQGDPNADNWTEMFYLAYSLGSVWNNVTEQHDGLSAKVCWNLVLVFVSGYFETLTDQKKTLGPNARAPQGAVWLSIIFNLKFSNFTL